ncbi:hypothetical protein BZARG_1033 [Bizionia argentinensis JUB59]|uniref:DUF3244 domain-containing protein n=1 Tax=Bizionia argentinensis JUB59 TaxID=1046627 RepID=G2EED3_9FLAO|nr:hypothetical protein [Bizionia argentinensis]EGV43114.1 hypothetical protein BZARG_1033 [Bizionia argentinensis JUB59]
MKFIVLLISLVTLLSCSRATEIIIDQALPGFKTLDIGIKNNTNTKFLRTEIVTSNGNLVFQQIEPNSYSNFYEISAIYSEVEITVQTANGYYSFLPSSYGEDTKVTQGNYYFEVSIEIPGNNLVVTRKSF